MQEKKHESKPAESSAIQLSEASCYSEVAYQRKIHDEKIGPGDARFDLRRAPGEHRHLAPVDRAL